MKQRIWTRSFLFTSFILQTLVLAVPVFAAPANTTPPVAPAAECGDSVDLSTLLVQPKPTLLAVGKDGKLCGFGPWDTHQVSDDRQVAVNTAPAIPAGPDGTVRRQNRDQRVEVITEVGADGTRHVADIVTIAPLRNDKGESTLVPYGTTSGYVTGPAKVDLTKAGSFVSATHFETDSSGTRMASQTQCIMGSCMNVNRDSCRAFYGAMDEQMTKRGRPPLKDYADLTHQAAMCNAVTDASAKAIAQGWVVKGNVLDKGEELYQHDLTTLKNTKAVADANKLSNTTNFTKWEPKLLNQESQHVWEFTKGCELIMATNGTATVHPPVTTAPPPVTVAPPPPAPRPARRTGTSR